MVVVARSVVYLAAWVAALDLDGRVPDRKASAQPVFKVAHDVLGVAELAITDHEMAAERHLV